MIHVGLRRFVKIDIKLFQGLEGAAKALKILSALI